MHVYPIGARATFSFDLPPGVEQQLLAQGIYDTGERPTFDVTDAAQFYGLPEVPPIVWDEDLAAAAADGFSPAAFDLRTRELHVSGTITSVGRPYDQSRFARVGVGPLSHEDAMRFVLAHELWHGMEDADEAHAENLMMMMGTLDHDGANIEVEADRHAAKGYKYVSINGENSL